MKTMLSSRRHHRSARAVIFFVLAAFVAGMVSCGGGGAPPYYELSINSTAGGSVATPGEGAFEYEPGESADLVAKADEGYRFVEWTGDVGSIGNADAAVTYIIMNGNNSVTADFVLKCTAMVSAGGLHTVGLKVNRRVVAMGDNGDGQCNVGGWRNITEIAAGYWHTVGLESDGTVFAAGLNTSGQCDVGNWTNITQVGAGGNHSVGLKSDGTVVAVGLNDSSQCDVATGRALLRSPQVEPTRWGL